MKSRDRTERLEMICKALGEKRITNQAQLRKMLVRKGILVTQATLSRDLRHLKVGKYADGEGGYVYALESDQGIGGVTEITRGFLTLAFSGNLGLMKTLPGYAGSIAYSLDSLDIDEILGTIAGDDTILIVPREGVSRRAVVNALDSRIPGIKNKLEEKE